MAECCGCDPAFNTVGCDEASLSNGGCYTQTEGLSKREYFAAVALQGIIAGAVKLDSVPGMDVCQAAGSGAVYYADALIEALNAK